MPSMESVQPLRISKPNTPSASPSKTSMPALAATSRPLAEIGSTERRRNSPSYNQATRKMIVSNETSPYTENSSPTSFLKGTPRDFWQGRTAAMSPSHDRENSTEYSPSLASSSPRRRPSVEKLAQASRVKNSNIFAMENKDVYDPSNVPIVERPSANRPMSQSVANNVFTRFDSVKKENNPYLAMQSLAHSRTESDITAQRFTPSKTAANMSLPPSSQRQESPSSSPTKSSLARTSMFDAFAPPAFDPENGTWSDGEERADTPRTLHRHAKSVTFHEEPPVVNEYEQQTPEPSSSVASDREGSWDSEDFNDHEFSFDRGSSADLEREDSFDEDLENVDKTPVVLPEDWSRMSPDEARTDLADEDDDVFDGDATERGTFFSSQQRVGSDGETRPLPPLPGLMTKGRAEPDSLAIVAERVAHNRRLPPSLPQRASCSKEDILSMTAQSPLSLEDRLKLMSGTSPSIDRPTSKSSNHTSQSKEDELVITNLDTGERMGLHVTEAEIDNDSVADDLPDFVSAPPRISRESILRKVRNSKYDFEDESEDDDEPYPGPQTTSDRPPISELAKMHPDDPIPSRESSRETSSHYSNEVPDSHEVQIKPEPGTEEAFDMSAIPAATVEPPRSPSFAVDYDRQSSVLRHPVRQESESEDEAASQTLSASPEPHSTEHQSTDQWDDGKETLQDSMALLTVKDYSDTPAIKESTKQQRGGFFGLPTYLSTDDYDFGMKEYITPSPPTSSSSSGDNAQLKLDITNAPFLPPPIEQEQQGDFFASSSTEQDVSTARAASAEQVVSPPDSPASVIRHTSEHEPISPLEEAPSLPEPVVEDTPVVPERQATIRTGGKLKARKSGTQADLMAMAEQRRMVSGELPVPPIPSEYAAEIEHELDATAEASAYDESAMDAQCDVQSEPERAPSRKKSRKSGGRMDYSLDASVFDIGDEEGLGLDQEFDRVIEAQKKGYLMRQNTKVVVATNRNFSGESNESSSTTKTNDTLTASDSRPVARETKSANSSPRKGSGEQFLKTEPWNGKTRRKSIRNNNGPKLRSEAAPPLPGKESALDTVNEGLGAGSLEEDVPEGVERGRLFVKVASVKNLDLPMPKNDRVFFQLTLDNGLHCVTTADMELGRSAPIGQEFELVVLNDLEFQLTLSTKLPPPPSTTPTFGIPSSPSKAKIQKQSGFSRLLSSPKKRAEKERQEREAMEAEERKLLEEERRKRASIQPKAWDLLHELVNAQDGSFARAYVNLKAYEKSCFGRQLVVDVPCYNEWALEQDSQVVNSVRSKRGNNTGPIRRPPYVVGQLQLQLLYVPKPAGAVDADLPKSMSSAIREINRASEAKETVHEGHLSQQGGDCIHWRRRFFRLQGPKLTAYHEHTHQKRAVINLSKASRLVDDRSTLIAAPSPTKSSKGRRKSAFAEEDEGYQYVEEGFRIRFANGETIDFYADSAADKDKWMSALSQVIGKADPGVHSTAWTDLVLARERSTAATREADILRENGTEVKDFSTAPAAAPAPTLPAPVAAPPAAPTRSPSRRKAVPIVSQTTSKSVPSSPVKLAAGKRPLSMVGTATAAQFTTTTATTTAAGRAGGTRTPPLQQRRGHRTRDAVKSMIF